MHSSRSRVYLHNSSLCGRFCILYYGFNTVLDNSCDEASLGTSHVPATAELFMQCFHVEYRGFSHGVWKTMTMLLLRALLMHSHCCVCAFFVLCDATHVSQCVFKVLAYRGPEKSECHCYEITSPRKSLAAEIFQILQAKLDIVTGPMSSVLSPFISASAGSYTGWSKGWSKEQEAKVECLGSETAQAGSGIYSTLFISEAICNAEVFFFPRLFCKHLYFWFI